MYEGGEGSYSFVGGNGPTAPILADQQARPADVRREARQTHPRRSEAPSFTYRARFLSLEMRDLLLSQLVVSAFSIAANISSAFPSLRSQSPGQGVQMVIWSGRDCGGGEGASPSPAVRLECNLRGVVGQGGKQLRDSNSVTPGLSLTGQGGSSNSWPPRLFHSSDVRGGCVTALAVLAQSSHYKLFTIKSANGLEWSEEISAGLNYEILRADEVIMEKRRNVRAREAEDPRENQHRPALFPLAKIRGLNRVRFLVGSLPDFRTMPLVGVFARGSPVFPSLRIPPLLHTHLVSPSSDLKTSPESLHTPTLYSYHPCMTDRRQERMQVKYAAIHIHSSPAKYTTWSPRVGSLASINDRRLGLRAAPLASGQSTGGDVDRRSLPYLDDASVTFSGRIGKDFKTKLGKTLKGKS
ncbi:hypothetical protein PR048_006493 [Dryococelus australis]|uniref:Uncharacterized protein n=1 Tax=Dryococelus australis TaxID=614101 RepID=A0ABQ9IB61_9NEOP|nr:hypothetical protein PR048_006493 [Dryococelus australis]